MSLRKQRELDGRLDTWSQQKAEQYHAKDSHSDAARWTDLKTRINRVLSAETEFLRKGEDWRSALPPSQVSLLQSAGPPKPVRHHTPQARPGTPSRDAEPSITSNGPRTASPTHVVRVPAATVTTRYVSPVRLKPNVPPDPTGKVLATTLVPGLKLVPRSGSPVEGTGSGRVGSRLRLTPTRPAGSPPAKAVTVTPRGLAARHALAAGGDAADTPPGRLQLASQPRTSPASSIQSPTPRTPDAARPASGRRTPEAGHRTVSPTVRVLPLQRRSPGATQRPAPTAVPVRRTGSPVLWQRASSPHLLRNVTPSAATPSSGPPPPRTSASASGTPTLGRHTSPTASFRGTSRVSVSTVRPISPSSVIPSTARAMEKRSTSPSAPAGPPGASRSPVVVRIIPGRSAEPAKVNFIPSLRGRSNSPKKNPSAATATTTGASAPVGPATTANGGETSRSGTPANAKPDIRVVVRPSGKDGPKPTTPTTGSPVGLFHSWKPQPKAAAKVNGLSPSATAKASVPGAASGKAAGNLSGRLLVDPPYQTPRAANAHAQGLRESDQGSDASSWTGNPSPSLDLLQPFAEVLDGVLAGVENELEQLRLANSPILLNAALQLPWPMAPLGDGGFPKKGATDSQSPNPEAPPPSPEPHLHPLMATNAAAQPPSQSPWSPSPTFSAASANGISAVELATPMKPGPSPSAATPASWGPKSPPPQDLIIFPPAPCPVTDPKLPGLEWESLGDVTMSDARSPPGIRLPPSPAAVRVAAKDGPPPQPIPAALASHVQSVDERVATWMAQAATTAHDVEPVPEGLDGNSVSSQPSSPGIPPNRGSGSAPKEVPPSPAKRQQPRPKLAAEAPTPEARGQVRTAPLSPRPVVPRSPKAAVVPHSPGDDVDEPSLCSDDQWYKQMQQRVQAQLQATLPRTAVSTPPQPLSQLYPELLQEIHGHVARRTERVEARAGGAPPPMESPPLSRHPSASKVPAESVPSVPAAGSPSIPTEQVDVGGMAIAVARAVCYGTDLWGFAAELRASQAGPWSSAVMRPVALEQWQRLSAKARRVLHLAGPSREDLLALAQDISVCVGLTALSPTAAHLLWATWTWHCRAMATLHCLLAVAHHVLGAEAQGLHGAKLVEVLERLVGRYSPSPAELASLRTWLNNPAGTPTAQFFGVARLFQRVDCLALCRRAAPVIAEALAGPGGLVRLKARIQALKQRPEGQRDDAVLSLPVPILLHAGLVEGALEFVDDHHSREGGAVDALLGTLPPALVPVAARGQGCEHFKAASQTGVSFLVYFYEPRDERLCAWLVAKGAVHFRYVRELKALLDCVRQCEQASQVEAGGTTELQADAAFEASLRRFYQALVMPFESVLLGVSGRRLVVVPHGRLWAVPFNALPDGLSDGMPMMDGWEVCMTPSCRLYQLLGLVLSSPPATAAAACPMMVVGPPNLSLTNPMAHEAKQLLGELQPVSPAQYLPALSLTTPAVLRAVRQARFLHLCCPVPSGAEVDTVMDELGDMSVSTSRLRTAALSLCGPGLLATLPAARTLLRIGVPSVLAALTPMPTMIAAAFAAGFYWRLLTQKASPLEAWRLTVHYLREQHISRRVWGQFTLLGHPGGDSRGG